MKWRTNNILLFLQVYQQYPILWNIKDKDYSNKSLRDANFKGLMSKLKEKSVVRQNGCEVAKIKPIRNVYRMELQKLA